MSETEFLRPRVLATTDGEIDDECSMVRFLLYANEWDVEGIVTTSSQFHWVGHNWAGNDWLDPYLDAYEKIYPNLVKHDPQYPTPAYLRERTALGNIDSEGEMEKVTPGSELIVKVLLDDSDPRPIWLQCWGGPNTIARALKTIQERHPDRMAEVASRMRLYMINEQDDTYQSYIRPNWEKYNILTIISEQFWAIAYQWEQLIPYQQHQYYNSEWMNQHILKDHGPLCSLYQARDDGAFRSEGDSPSFMHSINTGLRSMEDPSWGGWGGRFEHVRANTWIDPIVGNFAYPDDRWHSPTTHGGMLRASNLPEEQALMAQYYLPQWRWSGAYQSDWAARADWSVTDRYEDANHPPVVKVNGPVDQTVRPGQRVTLDASASTDPDGDKLEFRWWRYEDADTASSSIGIQDARCAKAYIMVPNEPGKTLHLIVEVTDNGSPRLTRYQRMVFTIEQDHPKQGWLD